MAVIYEQFPGIEQKIQAESKMRIRQIIIAIGLGGLLLLTWYVIAPLMHSELPFLIVGTIVLGTYYLFWRREKASKERSAIYEAGLQGELRTKAILQLLDNRYAVIPNARVSFSGQSSEMDDVVVGPTGVFIIETKNHRGLIQGDVADPQLVQRTQDPYGNQFSKSFYNPCRQVATHAYRLKSVLQEEGIDVWIQTGVFFSNPETQLNLTNRTEQACPVFHEASQLQEYLTQGKSVLDPEEIQRIVRKILSFAEAG